MGQLIELIPSLGFPIVCVIALAGFVVYIFNQNSSENKEWMGKIEAQMEKREEKLYDEIKENRMINQKAIETIAIYSEKLSDIQKDISLIKNTVIEIKSK